MNNSLRNDAGSVLVFITLMIVILMVMVGMGLDTGFLVLSRSMGQRAVDMAALAGAAGLAKGDATAIQSNIQQLTVTGTDNDYFGSSKNLIDPTVNGKNVTLLTYDFKTNTVTGTTNDIKTANAVRVALETANPYTTTSSKSAVSTPAFLTPLLNLFGSGTGTAGVNNVNVSAVSVIQAQPGLPIAINGCNPAWVGTDTPIAWQQTSSGGSNPNNSGWTTYLDNSASAKDVQALIRKIAACQGTGVVNVGTEICLNNGQEAENLRELDILIGTNTDGTPMCYLTPVVPSTVNFNGCGDGIPSNQQGNEILQYAQICPKAICNTGGSKTLQNQNLCIEKPSFGKYLFATVKSCNIGDPNAPGLTSCYSLRLVREYNSKTKNY
jgi:Flp pilus assembly protein TadG